MINHYTYIHVYNLTTCSFNIYIKINYSQQIDIYIVYLHLFFLVLYTKIEIPKNELFKLVLLLNIFESKI